MRFVEIISQSALERYPDQVFLFSANRNMVYSNIQFFNLNVNEHWTFASSDRTLSFSLARSNAAYVMEKIERDVV